MSFRDETTARIYHILAAIRVVLFEHHLSGLSDLAQPKRLVGDELVGAEAIVQLDHLHIARLQTGLVERLARRQLAHLVAHDLDTIRALAERALQIGRHLECQNLDRSALQVVLANKLLACQHGRC